ncbi:MAG: hypothetical protein E6Q97_09690 [Desulfurellales bacterium]|nr:MAG: hypothetical protein E6Q97_09690 [Desulfurellales bacterium]
MIGMEDGQPKYGVVKLMTGHRFAGELRLCDGFLSCRSPGDGIQYFEVYVTLQSIAVVEYGTLEEVLDELYSNDDQHSLLSRARAAIAATSDSDVCTIVSQSSILDAVIPHEDEERKRARTSEEGAYYFSPQTYREYRVIRDGDFYKFRHIDWRAPKDDPRFGGAVTFTEAKLLIDRQIAGQ